MYRDLWRCMIDKDAGGIGALVADDYTLTHMTGVVQSKEQFIDGLLRGTFNYYSAQHDEISVSVDGDKTLINEPIFAELGKKYGKTPAQVILRWHTQMGFVVIPGSKNVDHIRDNLNILDFSLTNDEMARIAALDKNERYYHRSDAQLDQFAAWQPQYERK